MRKALIRKIDKYYNYFASAKSFREWGFRKFRVLILQRNEERRTNLLEVISKDYGSKMFWLTTEEQYKKDISTYIFSTPKDFHQQSHSFMDLSI